MKKMFYIGLLALVLCGCSKEEVDTTPKEVEVKLDYTFAESGSMTRAGADAYTNFYNSYIKNKVLTPSCYTLTFKNIETEATATINGHWNSQDGIRLTEGEYEVTGTSKPIVRYEYSDSVFLSFNEKVTLKRDDTKLTLNANYDSFLLMFDAGNSKDILLSTDIMSNGSPEQHLIKNNNIYWIFMQDVLSSYKYGGGDSSKYYYRIVATRPDEKTSSIPLRNIPFEKGKYYYFNDMTNSFDIPPMDSGN